MKRFILQFLIIGLFSAFSAFSAYAVEVDLQWPKGTQFFDDAGSVLDSGTINIYDAGTTDLRTTYSDEDGTVANTLNGSNQIVLGSDGRLDESVYIPTGSWKFVLKDSGGTTLVSEDDIEGAHATSTFLTGSAAWTLPALSKTTDYTVTSSDYGKCINANPTGGAFTVTLTSAATAGDGKTVCVRHVGTANQVTVATVSSQTIDGYDTFVLTDQYDSVLLFSDGANWHIAAQSTPPGSIQFIVTDRLTAPPTSPSPGAWYIINGTPTGDWSTFSQEDIVRAAGDGGWHNFTPPTDAGWLAFVQDENVQTQFRDSAWVDWSNIVAPAKSWITSYVVNYEKADGTNGGQPTNGAWTKYPLSTEIISEITGASLSSNVITLDSGFYSIDADVTFNVTDESRLRWVRTDNSVLVSGVTLYGPVVDVNTGAGENGPVPLKGAFEVTSDNQTYELQYYVATAPANGLGLASGDTGTTEVYGQVHLKRLNIEQGPQGSQGPQGATGDAGLAGLQFQFDTDVDTSADGDSGDVRFSSETLNSVTTLSIDDADENGTDISTAVLAWDDSDSTVRGTIRVQTPTTPSNLIVFQITGAATDNSGWTTIPVSHISSSGSFTEDADVSVEFSRTGDTGSTGSTGSQGIAGPTVALTWEFTSGVTGADPGSGSFSLSSETLSAVTSAYFDDESTSGGATDVGGWIATWDDFGTASNRGQLTFIDASDSTAFAIYDVTGVSDNTGYWTASLSHVASNGTFSGEVAARFAARGDTGSGDVSGPGSSTDNAIARFDGTGGDTLQGSPITIDDDGDIDLNGIAGLVFDGDADTLFQANGDDKIDIFISGATDFEFTGNTFTARSGSTINATDTGAIQENSVAISPIGQQTIFWAAPAFLTPTTNPAASGTSEGSTNLTLVSTFDFDKATTEYLQTPIFQMPKGWDEGTVVPEIIWLSSATTTDVVWGVEGQCFGDSDALDSTWGTAITASDSSLNAVDVAETGELAAMTFSNAAEESSCIVRVSRVADDASDTLDADASFLGLRLHYTLDAATDN